MREKFTGLVGKSYMFQSFMEVWVSRLLKILKSCTTCETREENSSKWYELFAQNLQNSIFPSQSIFWSKVVFKSIICLEGHMGGEESSTKRKKTENRLWPICQDLGRPLGFVFQHHFIPLSLKWGSGNEAHSKLLDGG